MKSLLMLLLLFFVGIGSHAQIAKVEDVIVIDVRTADEFSESHIQGAKSIDVLKSSFKSEIQKLDKNKSYKVYCRSGSRSGFAEHIMTSSGFKDVENLGSLRQAAKKLQKSCEGKKSC